MAGNDIELLCIGNALVDVFARTDEDTAARFGITRPVQHIEIKKIIGFLSEYQRDGAVLARPRENFSAPVFTSGGGAANAAKIAAFLGARTRFIGAIGAREPHARHGACSEDNSNTAGVPENSSRDSSALADAREQRDLFGRLFEDDLRGAGAALKLLLKPNPTGICLTLRIENETRIAASPSAALELSEGDLNGEDFRGVKLAVIDGFMLGRPALVRRALYLAEQYGIPAALDLSSPAIAAEYAREIAGYARKYPLILFMNEAEAEAFYNALNPEEDGSKDGGTGTLFSEEEPEERGRGILSFFQSFSGGVSPPEETPGAGREFPVIAVKLGKRGAMCFAGGNLYRAETREIIPLDPTGAGDAFAAAFLTAWVRNKPPAECAALGNDTAGIILHAMGTGVEKTQLEKIAQRLKRD